MKYKIKTVKLEQIEVDPRAQTRAGELDIDHIDQMVEDLDNLPPMECVAVGGRLLLADGFHRFAAYRKKRMIRVDILAATGTEDDWIDAFAKANDRQKGKPRTRADKRVSVLRVVEMRPNWSARRVAEAAGVSHDFANRLKGSGVINDTSNDTETAIPSEKREGRDGKLHPATKPKPPVYVDPEDAVDDEIPLPLPGHPYDTIEGIQHPREMPGDDTEPKAQPPATTAPDNQQEPEPEPIGDPEQVGSTDDSQQQAMVDELSQLCYQIDKIKKRVAELQQMPHGKFIHVQAIVSNLQSARGTMWANRPTHKCPACVKAGWLSPECKHCNGLDISTADHAKLMRA